MTIPFLLLVCLSLFLLAAVGFLRWWFSGGSAAGISAHDPSVIAFGFPEAKYRAIGRLLDTAELRGIERLHAMPADLARRLESGRREVLEAYLNELGDDFRRAQGQFAQAQATSYLASPSAVRKLVSGWWRFQKLNRAVRRNARRGQLTYGEVDPLVREVRVWFEKLGGAAEHGP